MILLKAKVQGIIREKLPESLGNLQEREVCEKTENEEP